MTTQLVRILWDSNPEYWSPTQSWPFLPSDGKASSAGSVTPSAWMRIISNHCGGFQILPGSGRVLHAPPPNSSPVISMLIHHLQFPRPFFLGGGPSVPGIIFVYEPALPVRWELPLHSQKCSKLIKKTVCFRVSSSSWSLSSDVFLSLCVCCLAAAVLKLRCLGFHYSDKWNWEEKKKMQIHILSYDRWQRGSKDVLLIGVSPQVQFVHPSPLELLAEERAVVRCAILQSNLSRGSLPSSARGWDLAADSDVMAWIS